ncbi:unnamed protein product, partial [Ixodes persulcatus]
MVTLIAPFSSSQNGTRPVFGVNDLPCHPSLFQNTGGYASRVKAPHSVVRPSYIKYGTRPVVGVPIMCPVVPPSSKVREMFCFGSWGPVVRSLGSQHVLGAHPLVEVLRLEEAQLDGALLERGAFLVRRLGNLGRLVVADVRVQRRHQHERLVEQLGDATAPPGIPSLRRLLPPKRPDVPDSPVGHDADDAVVGEGDAGVREEAHRAQDVGHYEGLEDVELKVAVAAAHCHRHVVAHHLGRHHGYRLALRRVHLACVEGEGVLVWKIRLDFFFLTGHDAAAGLVLGQRELPESTPRSRAEEADVVGDLHEAAGDDVQGPGHLHHGVVRRQGLKLVGPQCLTHFLTCELGHFLGNLFGKSNPRVESRAHCSATWDTTIVFPTCCKVVETRQSDLDPLDAILNLSSVATKLLPQRQRHCILPRKRRDVPTCLGVGPANLDDVLKLLGFLAQGVQKMLEGRQQPCVDLHGNRNVHGCRVCVVGALS